MAYLKKETQSKVGIKCKRKMACWDDQYLIDVLILANQDADKEYDKSLTEKV